MRGRDRAWSQSTLVVAAGPDLKGPLSLTHSLSHSLAVTPNIVFSLPPLRQLIQLCDLYETDYLQAHLYPIAKTLAEDKVAEVRATATQLVSSLHNALFPE